MTQSGLGSELWHESPPIDLAAGLTKAKVGSDSTLPLGARGSGCGEGGKGKFCSLWFGPDSNVHSPQSYCCRCLQTSAYRRDPILSKACRGLAVRFVLES